jgi:uncharacterized membrane protein YdjX (TVP38/TMEM64 family)
VSSAYLPGLKLSLIVALILLGLGLELFGVIDLQQWLGFARSHSDHWWLILLLILLQAILFSFALAGSLFLWIAAPIYPPLTATFILVAGGTLGGLGAYRLANYLSQEWLDKVEASRTYRLLQRRENFYSLFAMRVFPAFPHSIVNYSAGLLKAKLPQFVAAAILGIGIKSYIYASVIHRASQQLAPQLLFDFHVFAPLVGLSLLSALMVYLDSREDRGA